jgi:hypothetical protein
MPLPAQFVAKINSESVMGGEPLAQRSARKHVPTLRNARGAEAIKDRRSRQRETALLER